MVNLGFSIGNLHFKNPVLTASGTCGYGPELDDFFDISSLGGIVVKGTTMEPREGNPYPRMAETPSGMLNAVGLQNKGIDYFEKNIYPVISKYDTNIIVNVNGSYIDEYVALAVRLGKDTEFRQGMAQKIASNKHLLYRDQTCITALEDFFEKAVKDAYHR